MEPVNPGTGRAWNASHFGAQIFNDMSTGNSIMAGSIEPKVLLLTSFSVVFLQILHCCQTFPV